jgi:hypothetical protein
VAHDALARVGQFDQQVVELLQDGHAALHEGPPQRGGRDAARVAFKQRPAQRPFQIAQAAARRRQHQVALARCLCQVAGSRASHREPDGDEVEAG